MWRQDKVGVGGAVLMDGDGHAFRDGDANRLVDGVLRVAEQLCAKALIFVRFGKHGCMHFFLSHHGGVILNMYVWCLTH